MSILAVFNYNQSQVRTITINNEPWFVAQDVCNILEVKNNRDALSRLDDDEKMELGWESIVGLTDDPNTVRLSAISESGLYSLVLGMLPKTFIAMMLGGSAIPRSSYPKPQL